MAKDRRPAAQEMALVQDPPPGVYLVQWGSCPRRLCDTGMPAGPEAEAVARAHYRTEYGLLRECHVPSLVLVEG